MTDRYAVLGHPFITESTESILYLPYQVVNLYTGAGAVFVGLKFLKGDGIFENYIVSDTLKKFHSREYLPFEAIPDNRNFRYNCFGLTFCDSAVWLNLNTGDEERIIVDEHLISTENENDIKAGSILLFYNENKLIHAIIVDKNGILLSKDGTQTPKKYSSLSDFRSSTHYEIEKIRILNSKY